MVTVDLRALSHNLQILRSYCKPDVQQMAVVKADAYGHGAVKVAQAIAGQVKWFAVNDVHEAIELRENGLENSILVFGVPLRKETGLYKQHSITATISSKDHFQMLPDGTEYHLNFDTGMGRLGFRPQEAKEIVDLVQRHSTLHCTGLYSHFATADEPGSEKASEQLRIFKGIRSHFDSELLTHMCNTAGTVEYPQAHFDLVRNGIGIYGYAPGAVNIPRLKPVMRWETELVQVNAVTASETVSYGATWQAKEDAFIGVIPVGYSDGIPRNLSGQFKVFINGNAYPVVGTVTMNYCMIYLGSKRLTAGTPVQLWNEQYNAKTWADRLATIPYEILTRSAPGQAKKYITE